MRKGRLLTISGMIAGLLSIQAAYAGNAGTASGTVRDSGGGFPASADFDFVAYLTNNPSEKVTRADVDATMPAYDENSGTWVVNLSLFTTWNVNDVLHVDFTDNGGPTGVETGSVDCTITGTNTSCGDVSLPVELSLFEARAGDGMVLIVWRTESETDNLGFHLYRATTRDGKYLRITKDLIRSESSGAGAADYKYLDTGVKNGVTYYYKLEDVNINGERKMHGPISALPNYGLTLEENLIPQSYALSQNFPNPFNPGTLIRYQLPEKAKVALTIYNLLGRKVRTLVNAELEPGFKSVYWDGRDDRGRQVAAGVYLYELNAGKFHATRKMVMMK